MIFTLRVGPFRFFDVLATYLFILYLHRRYPLTPVASLVIIVMVLGESLHVIFRQHTPISGLIEDKLSVLVNGDLNKAT